MGLLIAVNTLFVLVTLLLFFLATGRPRPLTCGASGSGSSSSSSGASKALRWCRTCAHTVGAPDGGPGLPVVNWSTRAGDLRVAHFLSFHALQILPLAGFALSRGKTDWPARRQTAFVFALAVLYAVGFSLLFLQAMRGRPLLGLGALAFFVLGSRPR